MCGRFALKTNPKKLAQTIKAVMEPNLEALEPRYNIAPSSTVPVIRYQQNQRVMEALKWGLVPSWAKDPSIGFKLANARADSVAEKLSFRTAFKNQRCLVPVDGFYEWNQTTKPKQPHYFFMKNGEPFFLAGLWEFWSEKYGKGGSLTTFTLITTEANAVLSPIHDRMPVILDPENFETWLDPNNHDVEGLKKLLKPYDASRMSTHPVSTFVSNARNEGPQCLEAIKLSTPDSQTRLL